MYKMESVGALTFASSITSYLIAHNQERSPCRVDMLIHSKKSENQAPTLVVCFSAFLFISAALCVVYGNQRPGNQRPRNRTKPCQSLCRLNFGSAETVSKFDQIHQTISNSVNTAHHLTHGDHGLTAKGQTHSSRPSCSRCRAYRALEYRTSHTPSSTNEQLASSA
jgi:hypothetical protein